MKTRVAPVPHPIATPCFAFLLFFMMFASWNSGAVAHAAGKPVVAVFLLENQGAPLDAKVIERLSDLLSTLMGRSGRFQVIPRRDLKRGLDQQKADSYQSCIDESCQIELGKELAASLTVAGAVARIGQTCLVNLKLFDLRTAATINTASTQGGCKDVDVMKTVEGAAKELARSPEVPSNFGVDLTQLPKEDAPEIFDPKTELLGKVDANLLDLLKNATEVETDARAHPEQKAEAWEALAAHGDHGLKAQATDRAKVWRSYAEVERTKSREILGQWRKDRDKLKRLLAYRDALLSANAKAALRREFDKAYAPHRALIREEENRIRKYGESIEIPPGFTFVCKAEEEDCNAPNAIQKTTLGAFRMDRYEVTAAQFRACVRAGSCTPPSPTTKSTCTYLAPGKQNHPVNCVRFEQAAAYCRWAKKRLPTRAEWTRAARGEDERFWPWGKDGWKKRGVANIADPEDSDGSEKDARASQADSAAALAKYHDPVEHTAQVGSFSAGASPFGIEDLIGNVAEWTNEWYIEGKSRVTRGGSWRSEITAANIDAEEWADPAQEDDAIGFRCASDL